MDYRFYPTNAVRRFRRRRRAKASGALAELAALIRNSEGREQPCLKLPVSQPCTYAQFCDPIFVEIAEALGETATAGDRRISLERQLWEYAYIAAMLRSAGLLRPGTRGFGFGVGNEPIVPFLAGIGCELVASDLSESDPRALRWVQQRQHLSCARWFAGWDAEVSLGHSRVSTRSIDMASFVVSANERESYDFVWSSCAVEHLVSAEQPNLDGGLEFVERTLALLRPGGVAVHTTEWGLSDEPILGENEVLHGTHQLRAFLDGISSDKYQCDVTFDLGDNRLDHVVDYLPDENRQNSARVHLKRYYHPGRLTTSFGIAIHRRP